MPGKFLLHSRHFLLLCWALDISVCLWILFISFLGHSYLLRVWTFQIFLLRCVKQDQRVFKSKANYSPLLLSTLPKALWRMRFSISSLAGGNSTILGSVWALDTVHPILSHGFFSGSASFLTSMSRILEGGSLQVSGTLSLCSCLLFSRLIGET